MSKSRVTLADVARRAGVSQTAASFVLSGRREEMRISADVEKRVLEAARATGYRPNFVSRSLRTGTTHTIGFVSDTVATTPFAGHLIWGALDAARERGHLLFIAETEGDAELEQQMIEAMHDRQVDGIVLASMYTREVKLPKHLLDRPAVLLNALPSGKSTIPSVVPDEAGAGRTAAGVLLDAGYTTGIYLVGAGPGKAQAPKGSIAAVERLQGITEALHARGVDAAGAVGCHEWQPDNGYAATRQILEQGSRPAALICFNDRLALGAYQALSEAGLEVPADVSVVSFDDDLIASWIKPRLTSVALPHYELGRAAIELLLDVMRQPRDDRSGVRRIPMPLRERDSVRKLSKHRTFRGAALPASSTG